MLSAYYCEFQVTRHMTVHSGAKPYACEHCDKAFTQNAHLMIHMEVHNGTRETKPRPYSCEVCGILGIIVHTKIVV